MKIDFDWISSVLGFFFGIIIGVLGKYCVDRLTERRRKRELNKQLKHQVISIEIRRWKRFVGIIIGLALIPCLAAIIFYFASLVGWFEYGDTKGFVDFAVYLGGIVTPIFSFTTLVIVLYTARLQAETLEFQKSVLEQSKKELQTIKQAGEKQIQHLKDEARKNDIYKVISTLTVRLETLYREPIYFISLGELKERELLFMLHFASDEALKQIIKPEEPPPSQYENELIKTKTILTLLHETIVKLALHLNSLYTYGESDSSLLFYEPTISHLAKKLKIAGYLPPDDETTLQLLREFRQRTANARAGSK